MIVSLANYRHLGLKEFSLPFKIRTNRAGPFAIPFTRPLRCLMYLETQDVILPEDAPVKVLNDIEFDPIGSVIQQIAR
jgi:hypothetical protein